MLLLLLLLLLPFGHADSVTINILGLKNGKGLEKSREILTKALEELGHDVFKKEFHENPQKNEPNVDINIFMEVINPEWHQFASLNWFVPNPECFVQDPSLIDSMDLILCKTHEAERIFQAQKTFFMGFASQDRLEAHVKKNFFSALHLAGGSPLKGTGAVLAAWECPGLPHLTIVKHQDKRVRKTPQIMWITNKVPDQTLRQLQNQSGIHLCCSETEGFGHSIMEAMSTGSVVMTTDAPPMNELITDKRCLVPYYKSEPCQLAVRYFVDAALLRESVLNLKENELKAIGDCNRCMFLHKNNEFKENIKKLMGFSFLKPIAASSPYESPTLPETYLEYVENRRRISTCTGVIWLENNTLMSIGVHTLSLDTYHFDPLGPTLMATKSENLRDFQKAKLGQLENIALSSDGRMAALSNNGQASIHLYQVDEGLTHLAEIPKQEWWNHGVRFSRSRDYLAYTTFGKPGTIEVYRLFIDEKGALSTKFIQSMNTDISSLQPKGIDFSQDDRFLVVTYAMNNTSAPNLVSGSLAVYPFDKNTGLIDPVPVSVASKGLSIPEDVCFSLDGSSFLVTNHANDTVTKHPFDQATGKIGEAQVLLSGPASGLSFPHSLCFSPDGKYFAVTNYGDNSVKIYEY